MAISNDRLLDIENGEVRFTYKDYCLPAQSPVPASVKVRLLKNAAGFSGT